MMLNKAIVTGLVVAVMVCKTNSLYAGEVGIASHYSSGESSGAKVACGGHHLNNTAMVAAHRSRPCGSKMTVTNARNGKKVVVTVVDRGPFVRGRIVDLSTGAARALGFSGLARVTID